MTSSAAAPRVGFSGRPATIAPWIARSFARTPNAPAAPAVGLLHTADLELREQAQNVATKAPRQFGRLDEISLRGRLVLRAHDEDAVIFEELVHETVRIAAAGLSDPKRRTAELAALDAQVRFAKDFLARREGEIARRLYAHDLLRGVVMTFIVLFVIGVATTGVLLVALHGRIPAELSEALRDVMVAVAGGAAGACVSVLLRLHRVRNLTIEVASSGAAQYRIYLGCFFAAATVFFLKSGLLAAVFTIPDDRIQSWFFWGSVGFLAGFNERWATNLISRSPGDGPDAADPAAANTTHKK